MLGAGAAQREYEKLVQAVGIVHLNRSGGQLVCMYLRLKSMQVYCYHAEDHGPNYVEVELGPAIVPAAGHVDVILDTGKSYNQSRYYAILIDRVMQTFDYHRDQCYMASQRHDNSTTEECLSLPEKQSARNRRTARAQSSSDRP